MLQQIITGSKKLIKRSLHIYSPERELLDLVNTCYSTDWEQVLVVYIAIEKNEYFRHYYISEQARDKNIFLAYFLVEKPNLLLFGKENSRNII